MRKIFFKFNKEKALETILYLANKRPSIDTMSLYKFMFFSDVKHLNEYGRPIFGGHYVAMKFGPVPSEVKNLVEKKTTDFDRLDYMLTANRKANTDLLSESDIRVLDFVYEKYKSLSARELSNLSHEHIAWINARKNLFCNNPGINYADMIENEYTKEYLMENSRFIVI